LFSAEIEVTTRLSVRTELRKPHGWQKIARMMAIRCQGLHPEIRIDEDQISPAYSLVQLRLREY
jgi:hypothetical protein